MPCPSSTRPAKSMRKWRAENPEAARAERQRSYAAKRPERLAYQAEYGRTYRDGMRSTLHLLKSFPCVDCGGTFHPAAMEFDHVRGSKKFNIGVKAMSRPDLIEEMAKCELRCANCHATRHAVERQ